MKYVTQLKTADRLQKLAMFHVKHSEEEKSRGDKATPLGDNVPPARHAETPPIHRAGHTGEANRIRAHHPTRARPASTERHTQPQPVVCLSTPPYIGMLWLLDGFTLLGCFAVWLLW